MKRVFEGKMYNTETAAELITHESDRPRNDFRWYRETLYRTPRGRYFLCGEGGAMSPYAERFGDATMYGEALRPLTDAAAREWLERYGSPDDFIRVFGEVEEA